MNTWHRHNLTLRSRVRFCSKMKRKLRLKFPWKLLHLSKRVETEIHAIYVVEQGSLTSRNIFYIVPVQITFHASKISEYWNYLENVAQIFTWDISLIRFFCTGAKFDNALKELVLNSSIHSLLLRSRRQEWRARRKNLNLLFYHFWFSSTPACSMLGTMRRFFSQNIKLFSTTREQTPKNLFWQMRNKGKVAKIFLFLSIKDM